MKINKIIISVIFFTLAGCNDIKIGNVSFDKDEVCSSEYKDCVPVSRSGNAQAFFFDKNRHLLSVDESAKLQTYISQSPEIIASSSDNLLPNWIGRVFVSAKKYQNSWYNWPYAADDKVMFPDSGNVDFLSIGQQNKILLTEVRSRADIAGEIDTKVKFSAKADATKIVDAALAANGIASNPVWDKLRSSLINKVAAYGYSLDEHQNAKGSYYYVTMTDEALDGLRQCLSDADWIIDAAPATNSQGSTRTSSASGNMPAAPLACETYKKELEGQAGKKLGLIFAVSIIQTKSAHGEICSKHEIELVDKGLSLQVGTPCDQLKKVLESFNVDKLIAPDQAETKEDAVKDVLIDINASYTKSSYKTLALHDHSSILAVHWLPIIPKVEK